MWHMIESLDSLVDGLSGAFTRPTFATACHFFVGWVMCLGKHTLGRTAHSSQPQDAPTTADRHGLDGYYNFFERSAWTPSGLAYRLAVLVFTRLKLLGRITLLVDDTLAHKRGQSVWGLGWWRDAVASTKKRVATASGHNWVVLAVAYSPPFCTTPIFALPLLTRLHLPGQGQSSCPVLAKEMLTEVLGWFPNHTFTLVADGAYACKELLLDLDERVVFVGRMRGDACVYDPLVPPVPKSKRGRKARKGPKLPQPRKAAAQADRKGTAVGAWLWRTIEVAIYGESRCLAVVSYEAVWPRVRGLHPVQIVVVRDPEKRMKDCYLFTTDLTGTVNWVVTQFAWRWAIEVLFRASKQVMDIEAPKHWSQASVEKIAPWVWSMQSVLMVWYLTVGHTLPEALELKEVMGDWDSEWSLRHMFQVLRRAILNATIDPNSADPAQLTEMVNTLKNWANLAA
jgi:DDE superfamily endonuclease